MCKLNGLKWDFSFTDQFTKTTAEIKNVLLSKSRVICSDVLSKPCATVADLPPYICTRTIKADGFTVLSSAYANCQLVMTVMIAIIAYLLGRVDGGGGIEEQPSPSEREKKAVEGGNFSMTDIYATPSVPMTPNPLHGVALNEGVADMDMSRSTFDSRTA